jgi:hypothetical protein
VSKMVEGCYVRTRDILLKHRGQLDKLASHLLEKEVIFKEDLELIFGKRPFEDELLLEQKKPVPVIATNGNGHHEDIPVVTKPVTDNPES